MTFEIAEFVEYTIYDGGVWDQTGGDELDASQQPIYEKWVKHVAPKFTFDDAVDRNNACLILKVSDVGSVDTEYYKGEEEEDYIRVQFDDDDSLSTIFFDAPDITVTVKAPLEVLAANGVHHDLFTYVMEGIVEHYVGAGVEGSINLPDGLTWSM